MDAVTRISVSDVEMLRAYESIPMYIESDSVLKWVPIDGGIGGIRLVEQVVDPPFRETFPDTEDDPFPRHRRWDLSAWGVFVATSDGIVTGGCVTAMRTKEVCLLEGRDDIAALWDVRVRPDYKRTGIGTRLFHAATAFAARHGCTLLKIETQSVNASACHFYRQQGCHLGGINIHAYPEYPEEAQLLWYLPL